MIGILARLLVVFLDAFASGPTDDDPNIYTIIDWRE